MNNQYNTPSQTLEQYIKYGAAKANLPLVKMIFLGILAGIFIALGAESSSFAIHGIQDVGIAKTLAGVVFPVGLMLVIFTGAELFTGNCLIVFGVLDKKVAISRMAKNLIVIFLSNLVGSVLIAGLVYLSGQWDNSGGMLGAYTIKTALGKTSLSFSNAFISGILCNILVCFACILAAGAKDITGKIWAIFFPVMAFVISGFEHCVANMYYIPAGIFASGNKAYVTGAAELYGVTGEKLAGLNWGSFFTNNLLPVTLGNLVGGVIFTGCLYYYLHKSAITSE